MPELFQTPQVKVQAEQNIQVQDKPVEEDINSCLQNEQILKLSKSK